MPELRIPPQHAAQDLFGPACRLRKPDDSLAAPVPSPAPAFARSRTARGLRSRRRRKTIRPAQSELPPAKPRRTATVELIDLRSLEARHIRFDRVADPRLHIGQVAI